MKDFSSKKFARAKKKDRTPEESDLSLTRSPPAAANRGAAGRDLSFTLGGESGQWTLLGLHGALDRRLGHFATAARVAAAAMATVATAVAAAMAAAVMMTAVAATARTAAIAVAAAAMTEGRGLVLTAHEGDSNQREKDRDTQNDDTIHPQILQLLTGTVSGKYQVAVCNQPHLVV